MFRLEFRGCALKNHFNLKSLVYMNIVALCVGAAGIGCAQGISKRDAGYNTSAAPQHDTVVAAATAVQEQPHAPTPPPTAAAVAPPRRVSTHGDEPQQVLIRPVHVDVTPVPPLGTGGFHRQADYHVISPFLERPSHSMYPHYFGYGYYGDYGYYGSYGYRSQAALRRCHR